MPRHREIDYGLARKICRQLEILSPAGPALSTRPEVPMLLARLSARCLKFDHQAGIGTFSALGETRMLSMIDIHKTLGRGDRRVQVLSNVSLDVARGEVVGVVGSLRDGSAVLLHMAAGWMLPDDGRVIFWRDRYLSSSRASYPLAAGSYSLMIFSMTSM